MKTKEVGKGTQKHLKIHSCFFKKSVDETDETAPKSNSKFPSFFRKKSHAPIYEKPPIVLEIPPYETEMNSLTSTGSPPHTHT